jgi:hypothetical protein
MTERMNRLAWIAAIAGGAAAAASAALALAGRSWDRTTAAAVSGLEAAAASAPAAFDPRELEGLPAPVARYFAFALEPGQPLVRWARIEHAGDFRGGFEQPWSPFTSVEHFAVDPPSFVWDARIRMLPFATVRARDSYIGGRAGMLGSIAGLVPVVDQQGGAELAASALLRYFAERAWLPTALLPSQGVAWQALDDTSARATFSDAGISVSMDVHFGGDGGIERVEAIRFRDVDGVGIPTPFRGRFRDYRRVHGMMIPMEGEVGWLLPEGWMEYWRGRIVRAEYRFAR